MAGQQSGTRHRSQRCQRWRKVCSIKCAAFDDTQIGNISVKEVAREAAAALAGQGSWVGAGQVAGCGVGILYDTVLEYPKRSARTGIRRVNPSVVIVCCICEYFVVVVATAEVYFAIFNCNVVPSGGIPVTVGYQTCSVSVVTIHPEFHGKVAGADIGHSVVGESNVVISAIKVHGILRHSCCGCCRGYKWVIVCCNCIAVGCYGQHCAALVNQNRCCTSQQAGARNCSQWLCGCDKLRSVNCCAFDHSQVRNITLVVSVKRSTSIAYCTNNSIGSGIVCGIANIGGSGYHAVNIHCAGARTSDHSKVVPSTSRQYAAIYYFCFAYIVIDVVSCIQKDYNFGISTVAFSSAVKYSLSRS